MNRANGTVRKMVYDLGGQLRQAQEHPSAAGVAFWLQSLRYDKVGKDGNFRVNDGEITWAFTYPAPAAFTLPADTATYDDDNRLLTWTPGGGAAQSPVFDHDGNMVTGPLPNGSLGTYSYDTRNRLVACAGETYRYNPDGHRVQAGSTSYVVDPADSLSRVLVRTKGSAVTRYVWGLGLLYEETGTATKTYHFNHQGSTVALTNDSGTVTDRAEYAPYGTVTYRSGSSDTPFLFHGQLGVMTETSGLVYMRARYYHPRIMRFINADPIGFDGGMNWYSFANNNPMLFADPSGFASYLILAGDDKNQLMFNTAMDMKNNIIKNNIGGFDSTQDKVMVRTTYNANSFVQAINDTSDIKQMIVLSHGGSGVLYLNGLQGEQYNLSAFGGPVGEASATTAITDLTIKWSNFRNDSSILLGSCYGLREPQSEGTSVARMFAALSGVPVVASGYGVNYPVSSTGHSVLVPSLRSFFTENLIHPFSPDNQQWGHVFPLTSQSMRSLISSPK